MILSLLELSGFAVLSVYSVTLLEVKIHRLYPKSVLQDYTLIDLDN